MTLEFSHLGIQCVRKRDIEESLKQRRKIRVDPYKQGFDHMNNPKSIDLNAVKLCFQVFISTPDSGGRCTRRLARCPRGQSSLPGSCLSFRSSTSPTISAKSQVARRSS